MERGGQVSARGMHAPVSQSHCSFHSLPPSLSLSLPLSLSSNRIRVSGNTSAACGTSAGIQTSGGPTSHKLVLASTCVSRYNVCMHVCTGAASCETPPPQAMSLQRVSTPVLHAEATGKVKVSRNSLDIIII